MRNMVTISAHADIQKGSKTQSEKRTELKNPRSWLYSAVSSSSTTQYRLVHQLQVIIMIGKQTLSLGLALLASLFLVDGAKLRRVQSGKKYELHENVNIVVNKVG